MIVAWRQKVIPSRYKVIQRRRQDTAKYQKCKYVYYSSCKLGTCMKLTWKQNMLNWEILCDFIFLGYFYYISSCCLFDMFDIFPILNFMSVVKSRQHAVCLSDGNQEELDWDQRSCFVLCCWHWPFWQIHIYTWIWCPYCWPILL